MKFKTHKSPRAKGFALVVTLSLMILLTVIAVGLLSLSSISLRTSASGEANARAFANARLAVLMAIGELQKEVGDDRRITADASILASNSQPHLVGAWDSWSPDMVAQPDKEKPDYAAPKSAGFRSWLISAPDPAALRSRDWASSTVDPKSPKLFSLKKDGFDLSAATVPMPRGSLAWAVSQENTKAKINVAGPETDASVNVALQVQRRPSVALSASLKQPTNDWNLRSGRVLSLGQIKLDTELAPDSSTVATAGASFTTHSLGLLTDAVKGGLKTDLNLGFELSDADFREPSWGGTQNPFRSPNDTMGFTSPTSYDFQRALFKPLVENPIVSTNTNYSPASVAHRFFAASVPTFDSLRSYYRIPYHLYGGSQPTVAERGADHVAIPKPPTPSGGALFAPSDPHPSTANRTSTLSVRPVLNRVVYTLSASLDNSSPKKLQIILTPIISLWNPYNTALEIDGAVAYPWMDMPFNLEWGFKLASGKTGTNLVNMSMMMGKQFEKEAHGRSVNPYFLCELTANGDGNTNSPIRFEPGEVRVFVPTSSTPLVFQRTGDNKERTIRMRPVEDINQLNPKGGFAVPMNNGVATNKVPHGVTYVIKTTDEINLRVLPATPPPNEPGGYHYFVSLEDAARIKNPADGTRGQAISEVQVLKLSSSSAPLLASPWWPYSTLATSPQPYAVIETFHRTAKSSLGQPNADLIYTTNPRHASINHQLAAGTFEVAPHFQSAIRRITVLSDAIQTTFDGKRSFWGPTHSPAGKDQLPFFEIPREPLLSLASFQHADLGSSTFSSANQFANSWASPYLGLAQAASADTKFANLNPPIRDVPIYDTPYLANESLWDGFFFSGAAPVLKPAASGKPSTAWNSPIASVQTPLKEVVEEFVADPSAKPLANSRMRLNKGGLNDEDLVKRLLEPAGCARIAGHLLVDGAFNVNSTSVEAWTAQLSALRGEPFEVTSGSPPSSSLTGFPRSRHPSGTVDDNWNGFRALSDAQIRTLAENLVKEVRDRGPFLSLGEFVNRRIEDSALGRSGAIQAAIDTGKLNVQSEQAPFSTEFYPKVSRDHIIADTGVGIPGFLTQADVLKSLSSVITCRSDTFTIRGYGEAKDAAGKVIARSWCEAVVQRLPEFVDGTDAADAAMASLAPINKTFGRRFEIISFRRVPSAEIL